MLKKEIAFLIPSMNGGGAEKVTLLLANELSVRGWKVILVLAKKEGPYLSRLHGEIEVLVLRKKNISKNVFEIASFLKNRKPSIFYSSMAYVNVIALLSARLASFKGKTIISEHSHLSTNIKINNNLRFKAILTLAKFLYRHADGLVCVSDGVKTDLETIFVNLKAVVVINNPVEDLSSTATERLRDKFRIISVGRLDIDKNFKLLVNAFGEILKELPDKQEYELLILGDGPERKNLEELVERLQLKKQVFLPGFVNTPGKYLEESDLFVFTSSREGFGNVLVEALSCGLPIVSTDCFCGPSEILQQGRLGRLVPVNDLDELKKAILEEIQHPTTSVSDVQKRVARSRDFSVSKITDHYEQFFARIMV